MPNGDESRNDVKRGGAGGGALLLLGAFLGACGGDGTGTVPDAGETIFDGGDTVDAGEEGDAMTAAADAAEGPTMTGRVVDRYLHPLAGVRVAIVGRPETVSDAEGRFTYQGVNGSYDLVLFEDVDGKAVVYHGLTRLDPTVLPPSASLSAPPELERAAPMTGHLTPWPPVGQFDPFLRYSIVVRSPDYSFDTIVDTTSANGSGYFASFDPVRWHGAATATASLRALSWYTSGAGFPTDYIAFGEQTGITLSDGTIYDTTLATAPATSSGDVTVQVTLPFSTPMAQIIVGVQFDDGAALEIGGNTATSATFAALDRPGAAMWVMANAWTGTRSVSVISPGHVGGDSLTLEPAAPPAPVSPPDGQTGVTDATVFSWTSYPGGPYSFSVMGTSPMGYFYSPLTVITAELSTTIPDLSVYGFTLAGGTTYGWWVGATAPTQTVDELAAPGVVYSEYRLQLPATLWTSGGSLGGDFTTAP